MPVLAGLPVAVFAGTAADLAVLVPPVLLLTMAGLALVPALTVALREITIGPLVLGPLFAFALSDMFVLGLGPFLWSLVVGTLISWSSNGKVGGSCMRRVPIPEILARRTRPQFGNRPRMFEHVGTDHISSWPRIIE